MSSLSGILQTATSGLQAAQASLSAVSDNISNVNTPGYTRKAATLEQQVIAGAGAGVRVIGVQRITDQYLQAASLGASADAASAGVISSFLDSAQAFFGDPTGNDYFFNLPDKISSAFAATANDPSSTLFRSQAVNTVSDFLGEADQVSAQINQLSTNVDGRIVNDVAQANSLLQQIDSLNNDIARSKVGGADVSGSENIQSQLLNQLSTLMSVKVSARDVGGVTVRTADGIALAGMGLGPSTISYTANGSTPGYVSITTGGANTPAQSTSLTTGEIGGLLALRNTKLPGLQDQLGEFVSRAAQQFNAASNASTAFPPPNSLTGRNTGLDLPTAIGNFTGQSTVAITNSSGVIQTQVAIDFNAGTMSVNGGAATAFTPATFLSQLNTGLGASGSAAFSNGQLSITAASGSNGVAINEGTSQKAGMGFSQFFGLNDLITSKAMSTYDTGLTATDPNGFTPGGVLTLQISDAAGKPLRQVAVTVPPVTSPTMTDLLNALNNNTTGVGLYGAFSLDAQGGLTFAGSQPLNAKVSVVSDTTQRGAGGPTMTDLFGLGTGPRSGRATSYQVNPAIANNPMRLPAGTLNLSVAAGQSAITPGDGSGALALSQASQVTGLFKAAGDLGNLSITLNAYAAEFGGAVGRDAATAASNATAATAVQTQADTKRQSVEGVNLDEELIHLTTFQTAYSANARMIQATKDLFDTLIGLVN